jgi:hypothetical protein
MGTPVIAYNFLPMSEIIHDQVNGFLIPCEKKETDLGVNYAGHSGKDMLIVISSLMQDTRKIAKARLGTHKGLLERNKEFIDGWNTIIDEITKAA